MPPTIQSDVDMTAFDDGNDFDAVNAFLSTLVSDKPSTPKRKEPEQAPAAPERDVDAEADQEVPEGAEEEEEAPEDPDEAPEDGEETEEETEGEEGGNTRAITDDDEVEIVVDGETRRASVKDLKRLYGQEAALTRKSQEVAAQRQATDAQRQLYETGLQKMQEQAAKNWGEYQKIDFLALQGKVVRGEMTPDQFAQLRQDATDAFQQFRFFDEELRGHVAKQQEVVQARTKEAAQTCLKTLTSPTREDGTPNPQHIEGWNDTLYSDLRTFAVQNLGADQQVVNSLVDPVAIKVLHMAMQWSKAQEAAARTAAKPKPVIKTQAKAPIRSKQAPEETTKAAKGQKAAMARLMREGTLDAGADAFLAGFGGADDD